MQAVVVELRQMLSAASYSCGAFTPCKRARVRERVSERVDERVKESERVKKKGEP